MHELVPKATMIGVLVDPRFPMSEVAVVKNLCYFVGARQLSDGDKWFFRVSANTFSARFQLDCSSSAQKQYFTFMKAK
jgi:hypothetical protein